jgi:hypothetical protein
MSRQDWWLGVVLLIATVVVSTVVIVRATRVPPPQPQKWRVWPLATALTLHP